MIYITLLILKVHVLYSTKKPNKYMQQQVIQSQLSQLLFRVTTGLHEIIATIFHGDIARVLHILRFKLQDLL